MGGVIRIFHTFQELYHEDGWISATGEGLTLHVDLTGPKIQLGKVPVGAQARGLDSAVLLVFYTASCWGWRK